MNDLACTLSEADLDRYRVSQSELAMTLAVVMQRHPSRKLAEGMASRLTAALALAGLKLAQQ